MRHKNKPLLLSDRNLLITKNGDYVRPSELVGMKIELRSYACTFYKNGRVKGYERTSETFTVKESYGSSVDLVLSTGVPLQVGGETRIMDFQHRPTPISLLKKGDKLRRFPWVTYKRGDDGVIDVADYSLLGNGTVDMYSEEFSQLAGWFLSKVTVKKSGEWVIPRAEGKTKWFYKKFFRDLNITVLDITDTSVHLAPCYMLDVLKALFGTGGDKGIPDEYLLPSKRPALKLMLASLESTRKQDIGRFTTRCHRGFCYDLATAYAIAGITIFAMIGKNDYFGMLERFRWKRIEDERNLLTIIHGSASTTPKRLYEFKRIGGSKFRLDRALWVSGVGIIT